MGWFNDQIKMRKSCDEEILSTSLQNMMSSVVDQSYSHIVVREGNALRDALKQLLHYHHIKYKEIPSSCRDFTDQLDYLLSSSGVMYRQVKLSKGWHKDGMFAMLASMQETGDPITLLPSKQGNYYTYVDPATGHTQKVNKEIEKQIAEDAYVFYKPFPMRPLTRHDFFQFLMDSFSRWDTVSFIMIGLLLTFLGMVIPSLTALLAGEVLKYESKILLIAAIQLMLFVTLSRFLFRAVQALLLNRIKIKMNISLQSAAMMRILSMPMDFFRKYSTGEMTQHISYINTLGDTLVDGIFSLCIMTILSLLYFFQIAYYADSLVLPSIVILAVIFFICILSARIQTFISREQFKIAGKEKGMVYGLITGIEKIRLTNAEQRAFAKWGNLYSKEASLTYNPPTILKLQSALCNTTLLLGSVLIYYTAVNHQVSVPQYMAFNASFAYLTTAFLSMSHMTLRLANVKPTLEVLEPFMQMAPEIMEEKEYIHNFKGSVQLSHISFKYGVDHPMILEDLSLSIPSRQYVAIVGKTGCGKSTLLKLLLGFERPSRGSIYYDQKDLRRINIRSLRKNIGIVLQDSQLFAGTIYENIAIATPGLTLEDAWQAAAIAGIAQDIAAMPMGMNTMVQEGSGGISGGQKQRILIARAVASKPKLLILDEATSALDNLVQKQISDALDQMKCTRIVIAHRLSTIKNCDRILVLDDGKIVEDGSYEELLNKKGFFADLVSRQQLP